MLDHSQAQLDNHSRRYSPDHRQYRKYAKIICHLRDDVHISGNDLPDSALIHRLTKKYYDSNLESLNWEEAIYRLLNQMKSDPSCKTEQHSYTLFFTNALLQLKRATFRSHIWLH